MKKKLFIVVCMWYILYISATNVMAHPKMCKKNFCEWQFVSLYFLVKRVVCLVFRFRNFYSFVILHQNDIFFTGRPGKTYLFMQIFIPLQNKSVQRIGIWQKFCLIKNPGVKKSICMSFFITGISDQGLYKVQLKSNVDF